MTNGTSTSSSFASSQIISRITFFWCTGIGFSEIFSTSSDNLHPTSQYSLFDLHIKGYLGGQLTSTATDP